MINIEELEVLLLKAGGAVLGLIVFYWTYKIVRGKKL